MRSEAIVFGVAMTRMFLAPESVATLTAGSVPTNLRFGYFLRR